jgi:molybdate transport system substrate-binding protein
MWRRFFFCMVWVLAWAVYAPVHALEKLDDTTARAGVTVLADPSLIVPLTRLSRLYAERFNVPVSLSFDSSSEHLRQLREGEEAGVFITAKALWMKQLEQQGLMDVYSRVSLVKNRLAIVGPRRLAPLPGSLRKLARFLGREEEADTPFALGDPEFVAEGTYAFEALTARDLGGELEPHYSFFPSSAALHNAVVRYDSFGAVFLTDALLDPEMMTIETAREDSDHAPILYQAAVVVGENMNRARHFLNFLRSGDALAVFQEYGFLSAY